MPLPAIVAALLPTLIEKVFGKKDEMTVDAKGLNAKIVSATKGLIRSKTVGFATSALVAKITGVWMLPLPQKALWALSAVILLEWGASIYLRAITKQEV